LIESADIKPCVGPSTHNTALINAGIMTVLGSLFNLSSRS